VCGPGGAARVHGGPRWREEEGTVVPCRRVAHGRYGSPTVEEEDETVPKGCSLEHKRRQRGGAMEAKNGGGLSSARG
jgi:hypothetical protein